MEHQQRINNGQQEDLKPHVPRVQGAPSQRQMPRFHVAWASSQDDEAPLSENEQLYSERELEPQKAVVGNVDIITWRRKCISSINKG